MDQISLNLDQISLNLDQISLNPDQISLNPDQISLNPDQIALNPDQIALNLDQIALNLDQIALNPGRIALNPGRLYTPPAGRGCSKIEALPETLGVCARTKDITANIVMASDFSPQPPSAGISYATLLAGLWRISMTEKYAIIGADWTSVMTPLPESICPSSLPFL